MSDLILTTFPIVGNSVLHIASQNGRADVIDALLLEGADVNRVTKSYQRSAIISYASQLKQFSINYYSSLLGVNESQLHLAEFKSTFRSTF